MIKPLVHLRRHRQPKAPRAGFVALRVRSAAPAPRNRPRATPQRGRGWLLEEGERKLTSVVARRTGLPKNIPARPPRCFKGRTAVSMVQITTASREDRLQAAMHTVHGHVTAGTRKAPNQIPMTPSSHARFIPFSFSTSKVIVTLSKKNRSIVFFYYINKTRTNLWHWHSTHHLGLHYSLTLPDYII